MIQIRFHYPVFEEHYYIPESSYMAIKKSISQYGYSRIPYYKSKALQEQVRLLRILIYVTIFFVLSCVIASLHHIVNSNVFEWIGIFNAFLGFSLLWLWIIFLWKEDKVEEAFYLPRIGYVLQLVYSIENSKDYQSFMYDFYKRFPIKQDPFFIPRKIKFYENEEIEYLDLKKDKGLWAYLWRELFARKNKMTC